MFSAKGMGFSVPTSGRRTRLIAVFAALLLASAVLAAMRASSNYSVAVDDVTTGGGAALSLNYEEADSAVGQSCVMGTSASANFVDHSGVVQPTAAAGPSAVNDWRILDQE
ncbi:hypothetical protein KQI84_10800 [bacterium]|nr:hypothetical protein [bacterium]